MRYVLPFAILLLGSCQRNAPATEPRMEPIDVPPPPVMPTNDAQKFAKEFAHALEGIDTTTLISYLDTSVTWAELAAVLGTIKSAKGSTDSVRVARTQTSFTMVNGKSSNTWKLFLTGYHEKGTTDQSVVVHVKDGRPYVVGYHVEK